MHRHIPKHGVRSPERVAYDRRNAGSAGAVTRLTFSTTMQMNTGTSKPLDLGLGDYPTGFSPLRPSRKLGNPKSPVQVPERTVTPRTLVGIRAK